MPLDWPQAPERDDKYQFRTVRNDTYDLAPPGDFNRLDTLPSWDRNAEIHRTAFGDTVGAFQQQAPCTQIVGNTVKLGVPVSGPKSHANRVAQSETTMFPLFWNRHIVARKDRGLVLFRGRSAQMRKRNGAVRGSKIRQVKLASRESNLEVQV
jgi:hypothetical protein